LVSKILGGRDIIEEFIAANIWPISYGWAPTEISFFNVNWAAQEVPFPQFDIQLSEDQSADNFMDEVEKKVNAMVGESIVNEYKAFKNLVKHKKRINCVFSEVCGDKSFHSRRPGIKKKAPAIAVVRCSSGPPKTSRRSSSKKRKGCDDGTSSATMCPEKTRSLESNKRKHKSTEVVLDAELQAATGLTGLSRKKMKKAVKKVAAVEVRRIPAAFDDLVDEPGTSFFFCLWPYLRLNVRRHYTPSFENDFVDVETFSDDISEVQKEIITVTADATTYAIKVVEARPSTEASSEFARELELTIHKGEDPVQDVPLIKTCEDLPEDQDPSPSVAAFNKSFGTSYRGELLSVGYEVAGIGGGASKILTLWKSLTLINETGEGASAQTLHSLGQTARDSRKEPCTSSKKTSVCLDKPSVSSGKKDTIQNLSKKGSLLLLIL
jgi:uncharacterized protein YktA (UPF0223 family)